MVCLKLGSELRNPPKKLKENDEADPKQCITLDGIMKCQNSIKKHTDSKKPGCPSCGQCTFCPAIVECKTPDKHKVRKLGGGRPSKNQKCNLGGKPMLPPWVTPSKAILVDPVDGLLRNNWLEQLIVTVPKIKTLYQNKTKAEMEKLKSELLASDEMGSDAQLIADLNSCIGKKVAFDLRERGQDIIKFGTVLSVKHKTNGKKKASLKRVIDGNFLVEFDDGRKLRNKDFGDIKYAMKYFEEFEDDDPPDDAAGSTEEADLEAFLQALTNEEAALEEEE